MFRAVLLLWLLGLAAWSFHAPQDRLTWWMEAAPLFIALPVLVFSRRFVLTPLLYALIALHGTLLLVGAHYTYALVPGFADLLGDGRNHFDRLGHVMQGLVPALVGRELLLRTSSLRGGWLPVLLVLGCLGISAIYELLEWAAAATTGEAADAFLGTQGDAWDTQKDMLMAGLGAMLGLTLFSRWQDRQLERLAR